MGGDMMAGNPHLTAGKSLRIPLMAINARENQGFCRYCSQESRHTLPADGTWPRWGPRPLPHDTLTDSSGRTHGPA